MGPGPGPWVGHARHFHHGGMGWGGWVLWILLTVAFWALVIMAVIWLVRVLRGRGPGHRFVGGAPWAPQAGPPSAPAMPPAEQILGERFARGEIDENEYRSRLSVLRGGPAPTATPPPAAYPPENPPPTA
jgi:putative membrane protein